MKNIFKTKAVPVAALSLACIGILAVSLLIGKEEKTDFQPEDPIPEASTLEWTETPPETGMQPDTTRPAGNSGNNTGTYAASQSPSSDDGLNAYPKVVDETEQHVTIDFTSLNLRQLLLQKAARMTRNSPRSTHRKTWNPNPPLPLHSLISRLPGQQMETEPYMTPCSAG